jgi:hypothetical protein
MSRNMAARDARGSQERTEELTRDARNRATPTQYASRG